MAWRPESMAAISKSKFSLAGTQALVIQCDISVGMKIVFRMNPC